MTIEDLDRELRELRRIRNTLERRGDARQRQGIRERIKRNNEMRETSKREAALKHAKQFLKF